ncbi:GGDEF domain-containing protein [Ancylobacter sp. A5.8]|uniref:GGDEF domain-containing protein n=1 Tax=Ancylobacter gelatini TaxID=2919920 RepID=UPI001F4E19E4|nr:GGDEF domain-containing protein [Ancylobacter gelatini]MCJ8141598.1 GGDEF domain-containing protein [Ancylobacter gelatini]
MTGVKLFTLLNPSIGLVFTLVFVLLWLNQKPRVYILLMGGACFAFSLAMLVQIFQIPPDVGANTLLANVLYLASLGLFTESVSRRVGVRGSYIGSLVISAGIFLSIFYFFYIDRDLHTRIFIVSAGFCIFLCYAALRMRLAGRTQPIDRVMFWFLLLAGLHFLPRAVLTLMIDGTLTSGAFGRSMFWTGLNFSLIIIVLMLCLTFLLAIALDIIEGLRADRHRDALVPLLNRRGFEEQAGAYLGRALPEPACLVFCDIDHFKAINDTYGHGVGDGVIRAFGRWIGEAVRRDDVAGRIGGEEFAILLPGAAPADAARFCERLRLRVEAGEEGIIPAPWRVTSSFGIAERRPGDTLASLMERADGRLYAAKRNGRNRVEG